MRHYSRKLKQESQAGYKEQFVVHEGRQAVEEIIQTGCVGSPDGGFQELPGQRLE